MGIFSFLTGRKTDDERTDERPTPRPAVAPAASDAARASGNEAANAPAPAAPAATPFTPPEAWNLDALNAPPPETAHDEAQVGEPDKAVTAELQPLVVEALRTVYDPEIPVDIYELGLIYDIVADEERRVLIRMTLTSPACPSAQQIPSEVRYKIKAIPGVKDAWVDIVWEPPWDKDRMSEAAKLQLGFF